MGGGSDDLVYKSFVLLPAIRKQGKRQYAGVFRATNNF
jgi:hypothetical protein